MAQFALLLCCVLIFWLYRTDRKLRHLPSRALWIPGLWLVLVCSRPVWWWLSSIGFDSYSRANKGAVDDIVITLLSIGAFVVLVRRNVDWARFVQSNQALILIYAYWLVSSFWAASGSVSVCVRLFKDFGHVLMALVLLTEAAPWAAIRTVFVRVAYVLLPLSIVLNKYFPEIGRIRNRGGSVLYVGVSIHKNSMGLTALVLGLVVLADLLSIRNSDSGAQKVDRLIRYGMLGFVVWNLVMCDSKTSLLCLIFGTLLMWGTTRLTALKNPSQVLFRFLAVFLVVALFETTLGISDILLDSIDRDETLTGRTQIWQWVHETYMNPLVGVGFYSYWETPGALKIAERFPGGLQTVHNGFLETYFDGGAISIVLLVLFLIIGFLRTVRRTLQNTLFGRFTLVLFIVALIYNYSETSFFRFEPLWFTLLMTTIDYDKLLTRREIVARASYARCETVHSGSY